MIKVRQNIKCIKDNRGFSIVELIIAIAIFAIASVPLLQALAKASKTNISAQNIQNATSVAEAAMEKIKATSIERLSAESGITYDESCLSTSDPSFFAKEDMTESEINSCIGHFSGKSLHKEADGFYVYYEPDVSSNNSEDKYDVIATIDTTVNTGAEYGTVSSPTAAYDESNAADANAVLLPVLAKIDPIKNAAISTEINKFDESAAATLLDIYKDKYCLELKDGPTPTPTPAAWAPSSMSKTTTLQVDKIQEEDVGGAFKDVVLVEVLVSYSGTVEGKNVELEKPKSVYRVSFDIGTEPEIYVFYKSMNEALGVNAANTEKIEYKGNYIDTIKSYLIFSNDYSANGSSSYVYTPSSVAVDVTGAFSKTYYNGSDNHVYDKKKNDYIYAINVCVVKDGKVCAFLTSTKSVDKASTPSSTPTSTPTPSPVVPGG